MLKNPRCRQGMNAATLGKFLAVTIGLTLGLAVTMATAYRANIAAHWEERKCDPGVVPIAGAFKPANDPRTAGKFAEDNWRECQKEYIQRAVAAAAEVPKELAAAQTEVVEMASEATDFLTDVFVDVWRMCYEAYSTFMDRMKAAAKLFQNTLVQTHELIGRMQASLLAIVYALISTILAFVDSVKITLIVAIIVIGILIALQIILFFLFLPISGLIITMTFVLSMVIVAVATAVAAAMVSELFAPGSCFRAGTRVAGADGTVRPIEELRVGDVLYGGGQVTAIHRFLTRDPIYNLRGIFVTGDHLVWAPDGAPIPVCEHPEARPVSRTALDMLQYGLGEEVWCLTTSNRVIPCVGDGGQVTEFADWEEIPDEAGDKQQEWQAAVWRTLNGDRPPFPEVVHRNMETALRCEAAIHPAAEVAVRDPWTRRFSWMRVGAVPLGAHVRVGNLPDGEPDVAMILGRVEMSADAVGEAGIGEVSMGTWVWDDKWRLWTPPIVEVSEPRSAGNWVHLYTSSGTVLLRSGVLLRDASDIGLERIHEINNVVVLGRSTPKTASPK